MIIQFGTSRFLQAHVDLFAHEARLAGADVPPIVVVKTTRDAARTSRVTAFGDPAGFDVIIRGLIDGSPVEGTTRVRSVVAGYAVATDWTKIRDLFTTKATHIVSNTGDSGYVVPGDAETAAAALVGDEPPRGGFAMLLLALLYRRWAAARGGITILPCELVPSNGQTLHRSVAELARASALPADFLRWLDADCLWPDTLVDRIVSEPLEPLGAIAEPYALWAIGSRPGLALPFSHPAIVITDELERFERLKLHILNLGHSWLADRWARSGARREMTVLDAMHDPDEAAALSDVFNDEVIPGFARHGMGDEARDYVATTLDRFSNPYLAHRLADIHQGHGAKVAKRIGGFIDWISQTADGDVPMPRLRAVRAANI